MSTDVRFENGELIVARTYAAPRDQVFDAWVATNKVQQWWGCAMTTAVRSEIEPRVGGKYNHHMTIQGAGEVPGDAVLVEFDPPAKLAYESGGPGIEGTMTVTVTFVEVDGGTRVRLVHAGIPDIEVGPGMKLRAIVQDGWSAAFEKLDQFLLAEV